jgi:pimeloyl-ACP methyl ester carboxylesterase
MTRRVALVAVVALGLVASGCESPKTDPTDLKGVFDKRSASANSTASTRARPKPTPTTNSDAGPRLIARERTPPKGPCIPKSGAPAQLTGRNARRPACRRSRVVEHRDADGLPRYACIYAPRKLKQRTPLPLVLFLHGENDTPAAVNKKTRLRRRYDKLDMTGEARRLGFVVLAPQARRIEHRLRFDTDYVALDNVDVQTIDHFIDLLIDEGTVDPRQIYAVGESHGGQMAALYAHLRPERVAAFGVYAAAPSGFGWSCDGQPPPAAAIYRACDAVTPCADVEQWLSSREQAHAPTFSMRLGSGKATEPSCALSKASCRKKKGQANHSRWPKHREVELLEYLSRYSLNIP